MTGGLSTTVVASLLPDRGGTVTAPPPHASGVGAPPPRLQDGRCRPLLPNLRGHRRSGRSIRGLPQPAPQAHEPVAVGDGRREDRDAARWAKARCADRRTFSERGRRPSEETAPIGAVSQAEAAQMMSVGGRTVLSRTASPATANGWGCRPFGVPGWGPGRGPVRGNGAAPPAGHTSMMRRPHAGRDRDFLFLHTGWRGLRTHVIAEHSNATPSAHPVHNEPGVPSPGCPPVVHMRGW